MFDADRPIQKSEQDRLSRNVFAKYLARCILDHKNIESLVIGLYGGWGSGKTSVINLMLEELRYASSNMFDDERPIILNFSAWSYSGQNQLIESFFRRLSSEMRRSDYFENSETIIHLLELYVSFFTHKPVPKSLRPKHLWLMKYFTPRRNTEETFGWESGRDLTQVKAELNELLTKQKHKIIIIIDNISRVLDNEMNQIFQIVKSMGDYANTVYVLAMDKEFVIAAMNKIHGLGGEAMLDKLVQLPFDIPAISKQDIENILLDRLKNIMSIIPDGAWDKNEWADIYYSSLKYFFKNCRDITRYVNTLSFSFIHVKDVVNPADFFAITAIDVFEPDVYKGIRDNKDLFTDLADAVFHFDAEKSAEDRRRCDEILNRSKSTPVDLLLQLLIQLFPHLREIYESNVTFYHSPAIARKNRRICSLDLFDIYFRMTISSGSISDAEMNAILSLTRDEEGFALALLRLNQDERIPKFLDLLDTDGVKKIPNKFIKNVVNALIDSADLFPLGESSAVSFNIPMRVHRIIHQLLRRFDTSEQRYDIFRDAIKKSTKSIYIIVHELSLQTEEHSENEDTFVPIEHRDFTPDQLDELKKTAVSKLKYWAEVDRLVEHPQLFILLETWKKWGSEEECKDYVNHIVKSDQGLLAFLIATLHVPIQRTITKLTKDASWSQYLQNIDDFIPASTLKAHAAAMFEDPAFEKLRENEQLALLIFLDLTKTETKKMIPKTVVG
jgi:predicted KAP-like P-loop ATPase